MADIELVIKIPEEVKNRLCFGVTYQKDIQTVCEALNNGTPILKECGNIYAEKDIREQIENPYQCQTVLYGLELVKPIIKGESK